MDYLQAAIEQAIRYDESDLAMDLMNLREKYGLVLSQKIADELKALPRCEFCDDDQPATEEINGEKMCENCWEKGMGID